MESDEAAMMIDVVRGQAAVAMAFGTLIAVLDRRDPGLRTEFIAEIARTRALIVEHGSGDPLNEAVAAFFSMVQTYGRAK